MKLDGISKVLLKIMWSITALAWVLYLIVGGAVIVMPIGFTIGSVMMTIAIFIIQHAIEKGEI